MRDDIGRGASPLVVLGVAFPCTDNAFFAEARSAFVAGAYYPALTAACCLGERILNHLVLALRDDYGATASVAGKKCISSWKDALQALQTWGVFQPSVITVFERLERVRHQSVHFSGDLDCGARDPALRAIQFVAEIVSERFGVLSTRPCLIPHSAAPFLRQNVESDPFIRRFYLPASVLVGPDHEMQYGPAGWTAMDHSGETAGSVSDEEFVRLYEAANAARVAKSRGEPIE